MSDLIYLASKSASRKQLLQQANLPFLIVDQNASEDVYQVGDSLQQAVTKVALAKMAGVQLPTGQIDGELAYVLTADTMGICGKGEIYGKPKDHADAVRMLRAYREGAETGTAFCLERRVWQVSRNAWTLQQQVVGYANATYIFDVPDAMLDLYCKHTMSRLGLSYLDVSGAVAIEDYGLQFVTNFQGSFTAVMGLPMYEIRQALMELDFQFE
jgi:septum formation protein